jgi:hypothetical protein
MVACKLPNGLIMQLYELVDGDEMTPQGPRRTKVSQKVGEAVKLNGCAARFGVFPEHLMAGYGLTQVDANFWEKWTHQNADADVLKNRVIFAQTNFENARDEIKERNTAKGAERIRSGLEPLDPRALPNVGGMKVTTYAADGK